MKKLRCLLSHSGLAWGVDDEVIFHILPVSGMLSCAISLIHLYYSTSHTASDKQFTNYNYVRELLAPLLVPFLSTNVTFGEPLFSEGRGVG